MAELGSILLADDEDAFRQMTAEVLRRDGYDCHCASDGRQAAEMLRANRYHLLIADIKMPGNAKLELVRETRQLARGMPIILVTGYPSVDSAVRSLGLPVVEYLTKPLDFDELRTGVRVSIAHSQTHHTVSDVLEHLQKCVQDLENFKQRCESPRNVPHRPFVTVPTVTIRTLAACLSELLTINATSTPGKHLPDLCKLLDCPQRPAHRAAIQQTVEVLQKTKSTFKSKTLAELRGRLECLLKTSKEPSDQA